MSDTIFPVINELLYERYLIHEEIGRGSCSIVYKASYNLVGDYVALKVVVPPPVKQISVFSRLQNIAPAIREISHPNIIQGIGQHVEKHRAVLAMQLVNGSDLKNQVLKQGMMSVSAVKESGTKIANALKLIHARGLIHGEINPQNIHFDQSGNCLISDLMSAQMFADPTSGVSANNTHSLGFIAPEIISQKHADPRSDIFSLGAVLYYALTGQIPTFGETGSARYSKGMNPQEVIPNLDPWISGVIAKATSPDPANRYQTAEAFEYAIKYCGDLKEFALTKGIKLPVCLACDEEVITQIGLCHRCQTSKDTGEAVSVYISTNKNINKITTQKIFKELFPLNLVTRYTDETLSSVRPLIRTSKQHADKIIKQFLKHGIEAFATNSGIVHTFPKEIILLSWLILIISYFNFQIVGDGPVLPSVGVASALLYLTWDIVNTPLASTFKKKSTLTASTHRELISGKEKIKQAKLRMLVTTVTSAAETFINSGSEKLTQSGIERLLRYSVESAEIADQAGLILLNNKNDIKKASVALKAETIKNSAIHHLLQALSVFSESKLYLISTETNNLTEILNAICLEIENNKLEYAKLKEQAEEPESRQRQ